MFLIRWIVSWCMKVWVEDRAKRRKKADKKIRNVLFGALRGDKESHIQTAWEHVPQRLKFRLQGEVRNWLQESAKEDAYFLLEAVDNAKRCGIQFTHAEESQLYKAAMDAIYHLPRMLTLAKRLYGDPLPPDTLLEIVTGWGETRGRFAGDANRKDMERFLEEIRPGDEEMRRSFLRTLASHGRYFHLLEACDLLNRPIPRDLLQKCFHEHLKWQKPNKRALTTMCIRLKDWQAGEELIEKFLEQEDSWGKRLAGEIALAMHRDQRQGAAV